MNRDSPSPAVTFLSREASVVVPSAIQELVRAVWPGAPRNSGDRIDDFVKEDVRLLATVEGPLISTNICSVLFEIHDPPPNRVGKARKLYQPTRPGSDSFTRQPASRLLTGQKLLSRSAIYRSELRAFGGLGWHSPGIKRQSSQEGAATQW